MKTLRIKNLNQLNWVIQRWEPPRELTSGKHKGNMSNGSWNTIAYYPSLHHALCGALDERFRDEWGDEALGWKQALAAIEDAREAVAQIEVIG